MKKLKESETTNQPFVDNMKQQFMNKLLHHFNTVVQDTYGNYVVQFFFDYFGEKYCWNLTNLILNKFKEYSMQKFSGMTVIKCVTSFWNLENVSERLTNILSEHIIIDLFRCKEGNRILLIIMEKSQDAKLKEKIYNKLILAEGSKFQNEKWTLILGYKSSTTATYSSFSETVRATAHRKRF